jgi:hypothetical protein
MWTQRNEKVFANTIWSDKKVIADIWRLMVDYRQLIWKKILERERKAQHHQKKAFGGFDTLLEIGGVSYVFLATFSPLSNV